jgi:hypothetical protein
MKTELAELIARHRPHGIEWGGELLLPPARALELLDDTERLGIAVLGADGWHYVNREKGWIVEEPEADLAVPESVLEGPDAVHRSAEIARGFIRQGLATSTEFVSLVFEAPQSTESPLD